MARIRRNGDSVCSTPRPVVVLAVFWAQSPSRSLLTEPPSPRAPSLQRRYPPSTLLRAHAPIPAPPIPFRQSPYGRCPGRLRHPRLVAGIFPLWACPSFLKCYVLYAGGSSSALDQFFPDDIGLHLGYPGSAPRKWFHKRLHVGLSISARQTFLDVVALQVARPPGRSAPRRSARGLLRLSFPSIRYLLDSRICYPADWSIAGAGPSPARRAAALGCT
jgi:hypothetical protein